MQGMTAFGTQSAMVHDDGQPRGTLVWELRSVNHRYLDITLRLPERWHSLEADARQRIGARLQRGKLEARLHWHGTGDDDVGVRLHAPTLLALSEAIASVRLQVPDAAVDAMQVLAWPGVVDRAGEQSLPSQSTAVALGALDTALADLVAQREREGAGLAELLAARAGEVLTLVRQVRSRLPAVLLALREKQLARLADLAMPHDTARLEQELVHAAQRMDVDEELSRLEAHVGELCHALERVEPVGRRLDFLMQEFNREANTLASKAADAETTAAAVELKVLIEQMREQVQNVE